MNKNIDWDLTAVYSTPQSIKDDLTVLTDKCKNFETVYKGRISQLNAEEFAICLNAWEVIIGLSCKLGSYAYLLRSINLNQPDIQSQCQDIRDKLTEIQAPLMYFKLEIGRLSADDYNYCSSKVTTAQKAYLDKQRKKSEYILSEEVEQLLSEMSVHAKSWERLYYETCSSFKGRIDKKSYHEGNGSLFVMILNNLIKDRLVKSKLRGFKTPISEANLNNGVADEDVEHLSRVVSSFYKKIAHRYFAFKAAYHGKDRIFYRERFAPYELCWKRKYSWDKAVKIVLDAFNDFSPVFKEYAEMILNNNCVDVFPSDNKCSGAYCTDMSANNLPYILLNFTGEIDDVFSLAHELGHGIHSILSKTHGEFGRYYSNIQAEIASIFCEELVFNKMYASENDICERFGLLTFYIESKIELTIKSIALHKIEKRLYAERAEKELTEQRICDIWIEEISAYMGKAVDLTDSEYGWCRTRHFVEYPFYVQNYAFSGCVVNSLFETYKEGRVENFAEKFMQMLTNSGIEDYKDSLARFGIDVFADIFWHKGMSELCRNVKEVERMKNLFRD